MLNCTELECWKRNENEISLKMADIIKIAKKSRERLQEYSCKGQHETTSSEKCTNCRPKE